MTSKRNRKRKDPLQELVLAADHGILAKLVNRLALGRPQIRRECFEYLKEHVMLTPDEEAVTDAEAMFALWVELEPDLSELDEYGGGDYETEGHVGEVLYQLVEKLRANRFPRDYRRKILDEVIPYIESGNAGMDDALYEVAYAACHDEEDLRNLAKRFEDMGRNWPGDHARRIYRRIGDQEKYLELRSLRMEYGADYHDLATFYWEAGDKYRAMDVARQGLKKAKGRMDELRSFLAKRAKESGDRSQYLELQFAQATDGLTVEKYRAFKKMCNGKEWVVYEPRILKELDKAWEEERLKIHMVRKEHDQAIKLLTKIAYPTRFDGDDVLKVAAKLERKYPQEILAFYISGIGNLNRSQTRKIYAEKAEVMVKVRHMWVDVMGTPDRWDKFAKKVKIANQKRPAFQEEFGRKLPGWKSL
ncbi:MAG: hypothetical protein AMK69_12225 [Nitrospira bacterium SG8_3]|nr:MAG: hypothetical protein AMK69_12225 [Nitrospira bacterium SG8_3]